MHGSSLRGSPLGLEGDVATSDMWRTPWAASRRKENEGNCLLAFRGLDHTHSHSVQHLREVEAQAAVSGWTTDRHVQAPTTDIPVSQVPGIVDRLLRRLKRQER